MSIPYGFVLRIIFGIILTLYYQLKEELRYRYPITIINQSDIIETHLQTYHDQLGIHYESYRNHCYRVLTYTMHFLKDVKNIYNDIIETSIVYHDLGLYNIVPIEEDSNIDHIVANSYLDESAYLAYQNTKSIYTTKQLEFQSKIISSHHKLWPFGNAGINIILYIILRIRFIESYMIQTRKNIVF